MCLPCSADWELLPAPAGAGLGGGCPAAGGWSLCLGGPRSTAGRWRGLKIPFQLCLCRALTSDLTVPRAGIRPGWKSNLSLGLGDSGLPSHPVAQGATSPEDVGSPLATELRRPHRRCPSAPVGCTPAPLRQRRKGRMWGREEEIGVGQQRGWHGDCAVQVILDPSQAPARLWLPAFAEGKAEVWCAAGGGELEFPGQLPEPRPPFCSRQTQPLGSVKCIPGSSDLPRLEAGLWAVLAPSPARAVRSEGRPRDALWGQGGSVPCGDWSEGLPWGASDRVPALPCC